MADKLEAVKHYWETHPLFSLEISLEDPAGFFATVDRIKREDVEAFALPYWGFDAYRGQRVLDVGCGPGWVTVNYAAHGAVVDAIDLTARAVELTRLFLDQKGLTATVQQANAESLPFESDSFDLVVSCGVLHHTPNTTRAFRECVRVLKPGGLAKITLYRKGILHHPLVFPLTKLAMRMAGVGRPGADLAGAPHDADAFIRQYATALITRSGSVARTASGPRSSRRRDSPSAGSSDTSFQAIRAAQRVDAAVRARRAGSLVWNDGLFRLAEEVTYLT